MGSSSEDAVLKELKDSLKTLYESGAYSDLTVVCGKDIYKVHKAIICPRSDFFSKACRDDLWKEGETGQVTLHQGDSAEPDVEAQLVGWLMHYFYHLDYLEPVPTDGGTVPVNESGNSSQEPQSRAAPSPLPQFQRPRLVAPSKQVGLFSPSLPPMTTRTNPLTHARMYAVADFYGVPGLKELANKKFREAVQGYWDSDDFATAVEVVYTTTAPQDCGLRQVVKDVLTKRLELLDKPEIEAVMKEIPSLSFDVLKGLRWRGQGGWNGGF